MERLMYDVYIAEATMENDYHNFDTPEKKEAYIREVFKKHNTTQAHWDTSLSWYSDRIDIYLKMNDSVKSRLQRAQREVDAQIAAQHSIHEQDERLLYSLSYIPTIYSFSAKPRKGFRFRLDSAEISSRIPENDFSFSFQVIGIPQTQAPQLKSLLAIEYKDTTIYRQALITENKEYSLPISRCIYGDTLTSVGGFVHLQDSLNIHKNIQLYNILLGNKKQPSLEATPMELPQDAPPERRRRNVPDTLSRQ